MQHKPLASNHQAVVATAQFMNRLILESVIPTLVHDQEGYGGLIARLESFLPDDEPASIDAMLDSLGESQQLIELAANVEESAADIGLKGASQSDVMSGLLTGILVAKELIDGQIEFGSGRDPLDIKMQAGSIVIDELQRMVRNTETIPALKAAAALYVAGHDENGQESRDLTAASLHSDSASGLEILSRFAQKLVEHDLVTMTDESGEVTNVSPETLESFDEDTIIRLQLTKSIHRAMISEHGQYAIRAAADRANLTVRQQMTLIIVAADLVESSALHEH